MEKKEFYTEIGLKDKKPQASKKTNKPTKNLQKSWGLGREL